MAPFTLINIPALPVATTRQDEELGFCFETFRCTRAEDPYMAFAEAMQDPVFKAHMKRESKEIRSLVGAYLGKCIDRKKHSLKDLVKLLIVNPKEKEELMTTIAQAIGQEYMQQGMQQEKLHIARNMLSEGFASNVIRKLAGLSAEELRQLEKDFVKETDA